MSAQLTSEERAAYARLADTLVPQAEGMPSASAAGVTATLIDQALNYRPDLFVAFKKALSAASGNDPRAVLDQLAGSDPEAFQALGLLTAAAYYLSPEVRQLIGYPGQERRSFDADATPEYIANGWLENVAKRPPSWRDPNKAR